MYAYVAYEGLCASLMMGVVRLFLLTQWFISVEKSANNRMAEEKVCLQAVSAERGKFYRAASAPVAAGGDNARGEGRTTR